MSRHGANVWIWLNDTERCAQRACSPRVKIGFVANLQPEEVVAQDPLAVLGDFEAEVGGVDEERPEIS